MDKKRYISKANVIQMLKAGCAIYTDHREYFGKRNQTVYKSRRYYIEDEKENRLGWVHTGTIASLIASKTITDGKPYELIPAPSNTAEEIYSNFKMHGGVMGLGVIRIMKEFASQETASLKAENEELKQKLDIQNFMIINHEDLLSEIPECYNEITALKSEVEAYRHFLTRIIVQDGNVRLGIDDKAYLSEISEQAKELLNSQQPKP